MMIFFQLELIDNYFLFYSGEATGKSLTFRAEYQTLIKLPKSKAIVFSIRTYQR